MDEPATSGPVCDLADARVVGADTYLETCLDHPEGVCVAGDGHLYASGEEGQIYRVDPATDEATVLAETGGFTLDLTLDAPEENLYVCDFQSHAVFRLPLADDGTAAGDLETVIAGSKDEPPIQPNVSVFDSAGRFFFSDSGDRTAPMDRSGGSVMVIEPDGTVRVLTDELSGFTNGLALTRDESVLYVAETGAERVSAVHLDDGANVVDIEPVTDEFGVIDGLALDAEDTLYGASIGDNAIYRLRNGGPEVVLADPKGLTMCNPTNVAFGGEDWLTMYVAQLGLPHLLAVEIDRPGRPPSARQ